MQLHTKTLRDQMAAMAEFNSSDGRVVRAPVSGAVDSGLIPSRVKPMTVKYSRLPCLTLSIKGTVWRTSRASNFLCHWERHLAGFLILDSL